MSSIPTSTSFYAITGVTGKVGKIAALELVKRGHRVRGIVRDVEAKEAQALKAQGVELFEVRGGFFDGAGLTQAFKGAHAISIMTPPAYSGFASREEHFKMVTNLVSAVEASGVSKVTVLSSWGAEQEEGTGVILRVHDLEVEFAKVKADVAFLRGGYFMENTAPLLPIARDSGKLITFPTADLELPFVATKDVGILTAQVLQEDFKGKRYIEVQGPNYVTYNEVAQIMSKIVKKPVRIYQVPPAKFASQFLELGFLPASVDQMVSLVEGLNAGNTIFHGDIEIYRGPTHFEEVAKEVLGLD